MPNYDVPQSRYVNLGASCDKRRGNHAVPLNLREYLNKQQMQALRQMEGFGWQLAFVRRKEDNFSAAVVVNNKLSRVGVLEKDGSINTNHQLGCRELNSRVLNSRELNSGELMA